MPAPHRIGPYRIVSRLGEGAMGRVFRARQLKLDRAVAVKYLPPELALDLLGAVVAILAFVAAYQAVAPLKLGELWAVPKA